MRTAVVLGTGSCLPERVLTNTEMERMVETSDEWITSRAGIRSRHIAGPDEQSYQLASRAARRALAAAAMEPDALDLILVATVSPHMLIPSTACFVQSELAASNAFAYDINAACAGFVYGLDMAGTYIRQRPEMKILVIGVEVLSARLNWQDRNTCVLFGDGAGAVVVGSGDDGRGLIDSVLHSDGRLWSLLCMDSPESNNPALRTDAWQGVHIRMNGAEIFKRAVRMMEDAVHELLDRNGLNITDIDVMIPHQANIRIIRNLMERLNIPEEKVIVNLDRCGNTSAASIPIALDEANRQGRLARGNLVLFAAFGAGLTWCAQLLRW